MPRPLPARIVDAIQDSQHPQARDRSIAGKKDFAEKAAAAYELLDCCGEREYSAWAAMHYSALSPARRQNLTAERTKAAFCSDCVLPYQREMEARDLCRR